MRIEFLRNAAVTMATAVFLLSAAGCREGEDAVAPAPAEVESVTLSQHELNLVEGQTAELTFTVTPEGAEPQEDAVWSSDKEDVASVADGKVTALASGTATVTVAVDGATDRCSVTVTALEVDVESVALNETSLSLEVGATFQLEAEVSPAEADYELIWSVDNEAVAIVDDNGLVTAVAEGEAVVTVDASGKRAGCTVTVSPVPVESVTLDMSELTLKAGDQELLTATVWPEDAGDKTVTWTSDDEDIATVRNGVVTAVAVGHTVVRAEAGGKTAECNVTVEATAVESVTLSATECSLGVGETFTLTATVRPADATDKTVTWSVDQPSVVSVDGGLLTALSAGNAVVTATAGDQSAQCAVTVSEKGEIKPDWTVGELFDVPGYAKGVVFEADAGRIKVVSLDQASLQWAVNPINITGYSNNTAEDGTEGNAALAEAEAEHPGNYPAYEWCVSKGRGWGLPSVPEAERIYYEVRTEVEAALTANGGQTLPADGCWAVSESLFEPEQSAHTGGGLYTSKIKTDSFGTIAVLIIEL